VGENWRGCLVGVGLVGSAKFNVTLDTSHPGFSLTYRGPWRHDVVTALSPVMLRRH